MRRAISTALALLVIPAAGVFGFDGYDVEPKYQEYENPDLLVSPERVNHLMELADEGKLDSELTVVDVRPPEDYEAGHLPGAVNVWRPDYEADDREIPGMRPSPEALHETLGELGITPESRLIVYSHNTMHDAFRFTWLTSIRGHELEKIHIMDGSLNAWREAGFSVSQESESPAATDYSLQRRDFSSISEKSEISSALERIEQLSKRDSDELPIAIVDARTAAEYRGVTRREGAAWAGRIPPALHIPYSHNFKNGEILPREQLTTLYNKAGIHPEETRRVYTYSHSGIGSATTTLVLSELLGFSEVMNYDGSWIEWSRDNDLPVQSDRWILLVGIVIFVVVLAAAAALYIRQRRRQKSNTPPLVTALLAIAVFILFLLWFFSVLG